MTVRTVRVRERAHEIDRRVALDGETVILTVRAVDGVTLRRMWAREEELGDHMSGDVVIVAADGVTYLATVDDVPLSDEREPDVVLVTLT